MNDLPTVFEVVTEWKPVKEKPSVDSGSRSQGSAKVNLVDHVFLITHTEISVYNSLMGFGARNSPEGIEGCNPRLLSVFITLSNQILGKIT